MSVSVRDLTHAANVDMADATDLMAEGRFDSAAVLYARAAAMRSAAILIMLDRQSGDSGSE